MPQTPLKIQLAIRPLETAEDYRAFEALQRETWGKNLAEVITATMARIVHKVGGIAAGAFDANGQMMGFVFGYTGVKGGIPVHWSHMLAVRESARNSGIALRLKLYQREELLKLGVKEVYWTYDPLVAKNAFINFNHLGVSVVEYAVDMYGPENDSELFRGLGTDRLVVLWHIDKEYIKAVLDGRLRFDPRPFEASPLAVGRKADTDPNSPPVLKEGSGEERIRIEIPRDIHLVRSVSGATAKAWRESTRKAFQAAFSDRYEVSGFYREELSERCFYCLHKKS